MKLIICALALFILPLSYSQLPTWENLGLQDKTIYDMLHVDSGYIYIGLEPGALYRSTNNGLNWEQKNNGIIANTVFAIDIDSEGALYAAALGGIFKSTDNAENWFRIGQSISDLEFIEVFVAPNDYIFVSNLEGIHRSTDLGQTWSSSSYTFHGGIEIGMNANNVLFVGNVGASFFSIYRSTDYGIFWKQLNRFATEAFLFPPNGDVFATSYKTPFNQSGIFKSSDDGISWIRLNAFPDTATIAYQDLELDRNGDFYLIIGGAFKGTYLSYDYGENWIDYGLNDYELFCISIDSSGYVYVGTGDAGIFRTAGRTIPVELLHFNATYHNDSILLTWKTATETNNYGFTIQRKLAEGRWNNIGFVKGNGTSTEHHNYTFSDNNITNGKYHYRLKQIDFNGDFHISNNLTINVKSDMGFQLQQNYPNPFNPTTTITFVLQETTFATLNIYSSSGELIISYFNDKLEAGSYSININSGTRDLNLSSGIYFYQLKTKDYSQTKKMIVLK